MLDQNPIQIDEFKGANRGSSDSYFNHINHKNIPFPYSLDPYNWTFYKEGGMRTRPPFKQKLGFGIAVGDNGFVQQHWKIARLGNTYYDNRWLFLTWDQGANKGRFYDSSGGGVVLATITGCQFASVINIYGRLYISPLSDAGVPLAAEFIYLYDGVTFRKAGGTAPAGGTLTITDTAVGGANVTAGLHIGAIAFESDSGFISPPGPPTRIQVTITAGGGRAARFANVDIGPAGTVKRHLLLTKTILNYDGIQDNYELFFGATINDNVTTTGDVILPDTGLVDSADYLLSEFDNIPSCAHINVYGSHLMYSGSRSDQRVTYVSKAADPETIDQTEDYIQIFDGIPTEILAGAELRGLHYIFKETCTYVVREDVDQPPNAWRPDLVDSGIGISPFGIAVVMANVGGLVLDNLIVGGMYGLYIFTGAYQHIPLSMSIQSVFFNLTRAQAKNIRMHVDPIRRLLFILIPGTNELWVGDYFKGLSPDEIKWTRWEVYKNVEGSIVPSTIRSIFVDPNNNSTNKPAITIVSGNNGLTLATPDESDLSGQDTFDGTIDIKWGYETGFTPSETGSVYSFSRLAIRALFKQAAQQLNIEGRYFDALTGDPAIYTPAALNIGTFPMQYYNVQMGIDTEHLRISLFGIQTVFIDKLVLWAAEKAKARPSA